MDSGCSKCLSIAVEVEIYDQINSINCRISLSLWRRINSPPLFFYMRTAYIIIFILLGTSGASQKLLDTVTTSAGGGFNPDFLLLDSTFVVASQNHSDWREMQLAEFELDGSIVRQSRYFIDTNYNISNCGRCLTRIKNHYYFATNVFVRNDSGFVALQKLNRNLDTLSTKYLTQYMGGLPWIRSMRMDSDSTLIATGFLYREGPNIYKYDLWIARLDTSLNVLWENRVLDRNQNLLQGFRPIDIEIDSYGSVIISGRVQNRNAGMVTTVDEYGFMARFDSNTGQLFWLKEFDDTKASSNVLSVDNGSGGYFFAECQILDYLQGSFIHDSGYVRFGIIDTSGTIIWDTIIDKSERPFYFSDLISTLDGNLYISGAQRHLPYNRMSTSLKFSTSGKKIWRRDYHYDDSADISELWNFQQLNDSGFIHVGTWVDLENPQTNTIHNWLIRSDKWGCVIPGCQSIGIDQHEMSSTPIINIYPNPTKGVVTIESSQLEAKEVVLHDQLGNEIRRFKKGNKIDIVELPTAVYYLQIVTDSGRYFHRLIKN